MANRRVCRSILVNRHPAGHLCFHEHRGRVYTTPGSLSNRGCAFEPRQGSFSASISGSFVCMRHHLLRYTEARLQSNFQIRLRLTFLRISSKRGWLDRCLELEFPDRVALWNFKFAFTFAQISSHRICCVS